MLSRKLLASVFIASLMVISSVHAAGMPMTQTTSGLIMQVSLATGDTSRWTFGGSATVHGAPFAYSEDADGLHIGVQARPGEWSGFYALLSSGGQLFHAALSLPSPTIPSGVFNVGLYIQTSGPEVNYLTCVGQVNDGGVQWLVIQATGNVNQATTFTILYQSALDSSPTQSLTRDCTLVTNGQNVLAVYFDGTQVFSTDTLFLGYKSPFMVFLESQSLYSGGMLTGTFENYYATTSDSVTITGVPPDSEGQIVDPSGAVVESAAVDSSGTVTIKIPQYPHPVLANIKVFTAGVEVASTTSPVSIWGGDGYALSL